MINPPILSGIRRNVSWLINQYYRWPNNCWTLIRTVFKTILAPSPSLFLLASQVFSLSSRVFNLYQYHSEQPTAIRSPIPHTTTLTNPELQAFVDSLPPETHHLVYTVLQCNPLATGQTKPVPGTAPQTATLPVLDPVTLLQPAPIPGNLAGLPPNATGPGSLSSLSTLLIPVPAPPAATDALLGLAPGPAPPPVSIPAPVPVPSLLTPIPTKPPQAAPPIATPLPPGSPLENLHQYLDLTRRLQVHLSRPGETTISDADVRVIKEIASLPLPNSFTVPVCQEWVNFASTFNGNVKVTLDPKHKSNKFKFEFFQQIALFYCIRNFIENQNQPVSVCFVIWSNHLFLPVSDTTSWWSRLESNVLHRSDGCDHNFRRFSVTFMVFPANQRFNKATRWSEANGSNSSKFWFLFTYSSTFCLLFSMKKLGIKTTVMDICSLQLIIYFWPGNLSFLNFFKVSIQKTTSSPIRNE